MIIVPGQPGPIPRPEPATERPRALIVDQQPLFVDALASLLERPPLLATSLRALGSDVALELLREEGADVVLCGLRLDPVPLPAFLDRLRTLDHPPPVIVLGAPGEEDDLLDLVAGEIAGVFTNNSEPEKFLAGVEAVIAGHRVIGDPLLHRLLGRRPPTDGDRPGPRLGLLSPTERDILIMVGAALTINEIAGRRGISPKTVRNHLASIYRKLDLRSRTEAMLYAARMGLVSDRQGPRSQS